MSSRTVDLELQVTPCPAGLEVRAPGQATRLVSRAELVEGLLGRRSDLTRAEAEQYVDRWLSDETAP